MIRFYTKYLIEEKTKFAVREEIWIYFISAEIKLSTSSVTSHEFSQSNILRLLKQGTLSGEKEKKTGYIPKQTKQKSEKVMEPYAIGEETEYRNVPSFYHNDRLQERTFLASSHFFVLEFAK